jgi:cytosine/adenosine deaminase-related metal-dependent hydrolase
VVVRGGLIADGRLRVAAVVDAGSVKLRPGLINAHDHLYLNHYPRLGTPPYRNAYEWGNDLHARCQADIDRAGALPRQDALLFGALKNLLGGVTNVVQHDPWDEALNGTFPIRVVRVRVAHSLGFERDLERAVAGDSETRTRPLSMHLAEGTDATAGCEVPESEKRGLLSGQLLAVHAVGVDRDGIRRLQQAGVAIIWCPTSNHFLLGRTACAELLNSGIDVLLGTDSLLTGDGTMLHELRAARSLGVVSDRVLLNAVGETAARRLGLPAPALKPGRPADLVALGAPPLEATARDVSLVIVAGIPRLGDERFHQLFSTCGVQTQPITVGGVRKLVAAPLGTVAQRCCQLTPEVGRIFAG